MTREFKDYYKILSVSKEATSDEINKSFRKLSRKYHPDILKEDKAKEKYQEITEAYEVLSNASKRKEYDAFYEKSNKSTYSQNINDERIKLKKQIVIVLKINDVLDKEYNKIMNNNTGEDLKEIVFNCKEGFNVINNYISSLIKKLDNVNLVKEKILLVEKYNYNNECINNLKDKLLNRYNDLIMCYIDQIDYFIFLTKDKNFYEKIVKLQKELDNFIREMNVLNAEEIQENLEKLKQRIILLQNLLLKMETENEQYSLSNTKKKKL